MTSKVTGAATAAPVMTPGLFEDVMYFVIHGDFTSPQLAKLRRECQRQLRIQTKTGMILAEATIQEGDRVKINENYYYVSMVGVTGTVKEVASHRSGKSAWTSIKFEADSLPGRRPKYAIGTDGLVHVGGNCVDILKSV